MAILGLPDLLVPFATPVVALMTQDTALFGLSIAPQWGLYQSGVPVVIAESVVAAEFRRNWAIGTYAVEKGSFASYDKVNLPFSFRLRFASGGSLANRVALLQSAQAAADSTTLYDVVTPEQVYVGVTAQQVDYSRAATQGLSLIQFDMSVMEVRELGSGVPTTSQQPSGAATENGGTVQTTAVAPAAYGFGVGV